MAIKTKPLDLATLFTAEDEQIDLINDALATRHIGYIATALGTVARARGMSKVADGTDLSRQGLYNTLSASGNPTFDTIMKVLDVLGIELEAKAKVRELEHA